MKYIAENNVTNYFMTDVSKDVTNRVINDVTNCVIIAVSKEAEQDLQTWLAVVERLSEILQLGTAAPLPMLSG